jgi:hypothetical protein
MNLNSIQSKDDLVQWAKEVNFGISTEQKCRYQDIYAHSNKDDIEKFFIETVSDRALILCSVYNTMSYDTVEQLLKHLAWHKMSEQMKIEYEELDKKVSTLAAKERAFQESMKPFHKRMSELRKRNEFLEHAFSDIKAREAYLVEDSRALKREVKDLEAKAFRYDTIRELLQCDGR